MQFQVPQFIETEDKILGPLTIKQFLAVTATGIVILFLFSIVQFWLWVVIAITAIIISLSATVIQYNGRPLLIMIISMLSYAWSPHTYVWQPDNTDSLFGEDISPIMQTTDSLQKKPADHKARSSQGKLRDLKSRLTTALHEPEEPLTNNGDKM